MTIRDLENTISQWIQLKMNDIHDRHVDLSQSYNFHIDGEEIKIIIKDNGNLAPGHMSMLKTLVGYINRNELTIESITRDLNRTSSK